jgi:hypothetical protein
MQKFLLVFGQASCVFNSRQLPDRRLSRPTTLLNSNMRVRETPLHVWQSPMIRRWWMDDIGLLALAGNVARSWDIGTFATAVRVVEVFVVGIASHLCEIDVYYYNNAAKEM